VLKRLVRNADVTRGRGTGSFGVSKTLVFETDQKILVLYILFGGVVRVFQFTHANSAYVRVSTDDQNEQRQMRAIREKYDEDQEDNQIEWYCDLGKSGATTSRQEYQRLREHVAEYDVVVAHELDPLK
jgi:hypothetical protein